MTVKTGIGVMPRSAKACRQQSQTGRGKEGPLPSLSLQRVHGLADTLVSDFWSPELQEKKCLWFYVAPFMVLCSGHLGKLTQHLMAACAEAELQL